LRIALLGNMNNNSNNLAKYLLDMGYTCDVLFFKNEAEHFYPDADNIDPVNYGVKQLTWGSYKDYFVTTKKNINNDLLDYDFLIGSRLSPAYMLRVNKILDIFMPTGGELHTLPVFNSWGIRDLIKYLGFSKIQLNAIRSVGCLFWDDTNNEVEQTIAPIIHGLDRIRHAIPMVYYPEFQGNSLERRKDASKWLDRFIAARADADIYLFNHVKHVWTRNTINRYGKYHEKGNDQVVKALASYYKGQPEVKIKVAMFEYGSDHIQTRKLAKELEIDHYIDWFPQLPRKEIMLGIMISDAVIGEITRSWFSYGTIIEAMAMQKTVIHHRNDYLYPTKKMYPMLHVNNEETLAEIFQKIAQGQVNLVGMGKEAFEWLRDYGVGQALKEITHKIDIKLNL